MLCRSSGTVKRYSTIWHFLAFKGFLWGRGDVTLIQPQSILNKEFVYGINTVLLNFREKWRSGKRAGRSMGKRKRRNTERNQGRGETQREAIYCNFIYSS